MGKTTPTALMAREARSIIVAEVVAVDRGREGMPLIHHRREIKRPMHQD